MGGETRTGVIPDIVADVRSSVQRARRDSPVLSNRASGIGEECLRCMVYNRTHWQKKAAPPVERLMLFQGGNLVEEHVIRLLRMAGYGILEQQRAFVVNEKKENITGHIDLKIQTDTGGVYPVEIKGLAGHSYDRLNTIGDFFGSDRPYIRKYPAQLLTYLYGTGHEVGCLLLCSKQSWQLKPIWVALEDHIPYVQRLLDRAIEVERHVKEGTVPDFHDDPSLCVHCDFAHICNPPLSGTAEIVSDEELEEDLRRWYELRPSKGEYEALDKRVKAAVKEREILVGDFHVMGKWVKKNEPAREARESKYWLTKIVNLKEKGKADGD